ncbi:MAG: YdcF family protein [Oscillospiraceae bacterium]|nr:YdcF family protein [Oscillospiraceae bacterium]
MDRKLRKDSLGWFFAIGFFILGFLIKICLVGYSFSAFLCWGCAGLAACYRLLNLLMRQCPRLAFWLRWVLTVCICLVILAGLLTYGVIYRASYGEPHSECHYMVVLGAGVNGTVPSLSLQERLDAAYEYLTEFPDTICVVSGCQGSGEDISEAQCMYNELVEMGIDPSRVWMEDQATNTRENLQYSLDLIESRTGSRPEKIGIVSSEYHLFRACLFAQEQNVGSFGIPAKTGWVSLRINYYLREVAAVWYYTILGG